MKQYFNKKPLKVILFLLLLFLPLANNFLELYFNCLNIFDFGIYQQAIFKLAEGLSWNPYVSVRDIHIFNEHFDPIIYLSVPFVWMSQFNPYSLLVFEWLFYVLTFFVIKKTLKNQNDFLLFILFFIALFSRSFLSAFTYPIHPVTWAIPLLVWLPSLIRDNKKKSILALCFILLITKETFCFGIFALSFFYLFKKDYRFFFQMFFLSSFFIIFELKLRPVWFGQTISYANNYLGDILAHPYDYLTKLLVDFDYKSFFKVLYPYLLPFVWIYKDILKDKKNFFKSDLWAVFLFSAPLLIIHFIINRYYVHHASKFGAIWLGLLISSQVFEKRLHKKKKIFLVLLFFFASSSSLYTKMIKHLTLQKRDHCTYDQEKLKDEETIQLYSSRMGKNQNRKSVKKIKET